MAFKRKILSIDGGGIRGIIPAIVLDYIQKKVNKPIAEMFDLIAGTSTGGILALGMTKPKSDGSPEFSPAAIAEMYRNEGKDIFRERFPGPIDELIQSKFGAEDRLKVLTRKFGTTLIRDSLTETFITSYDIESRVPVFFTSNLTAEVNDQYYEKICRDFTMLDAVMASSAAPTFFPPHKVTKQRPTGMQMQDGENMAESNHYALVDGGVFANNPASLALMETMISYKRDTGEELNRKDVLLVSLGTGSLTHKFDYDEAKGWGQLKWALPILNIFNDAQSEAVACQLDQLLISSGDKKQYFRFQGLLSNDAMDNASQTNIALLEALANKIITDNQSDLDKVCKLLLED